MNITILSLSHSPNRVLPVSSVFLFVLSLLFLGLAQLLPATQNGVDDFARSRREMVEKDLSGRGIKDRRVLEAMNMVPRHLFVPERHRPSAYQDRPLPIGEDQTISQPYLVALMTELLELKGNEKALEIGTGSGYQAAVLSHLAKEIYTIEIIPSLAQRAKETLARLGYVNVWVKVGDGFFGWEEKGPFDAILVTASAQKIPEPLWYQLREEGRLVMPLGGERQTQRLIRVRKLAGRRHIEYITGVIFVPMTGAVQKDR